MMPIEYTISSHNIQNNAGSFRTKTFFTTSVRRNTCSLKRVANSHDVALQPDSEAAGWLYGTI